MTNELNVKTYRWLFYISSLQLVVFFLFPAITMGTPAKYILYVEILAALTLGLIPGFFLMAVSIWGLFIDRKRRRLYIPVIVFVGLWIMWAAVSWLYIEHMDYLL